MIFAGPLAVSAINIEVFPLRTDDKSPSRYQKLPLLFLTMCS